MSTVTASAPTRKVSRPRVLHPVTVTLSGLVYDRETGQGTVSLNGKMYLLERVSDRGRTVGLSFGPIDGSAGDRFHHVDLTAAPWACDCEDATFNGSRPGGCKHVNAARLLARQLRESA